MLLLLFFIQLAVWYGVYRQVLRIPYPSPKESACPPLSVVIAARNEAENLHRFLPAVLHQDYPDFEVLVVDDASTDGTLAVLQAYAKIYPHLRVFNLAHKQHPGKKAALSHAVEAARHPHLVFTDADCCPASSQWLRFMASVWQPEVEIVLGYAPFFPEDTFFNRWVRFEADMAALTYLSLAQMGLPYMGVGRNLAWRMAAYRRTAGFSAHADLPGGDDDLLVNAVADSKNTAIALAPEALVFSPAKKNFRAWLHQKRRHLGAGNRYKPLHRLLLTALSLSRAVFHLVCAVTLFTADWPWAVGALLGRWMLIFPLYGFVYRRLQSPNSEYRRLQSPRFVYRRLQSPNSAYRRLKSPVRGTKASLLRRLKSTVRGAEFALFDMLLSVYDAFVVPWALWRKTGRW